MDNIKNDQYYIKQAVENIDIIIQYSKGKTYEEFIEDSIVLDAIMFRFIETKKRII